MTIHALLMVLIAGTELAVAYLRAEYVLHRGLNAAEHRKLTVRRELHAKRPKLKQIGVPAAALRNHQPFLSKESAHCAPPESPSTVYSRKSTNIGIARHREPA
jgi:hypothetical protein